VLGKPRTPWAGSTIGKDCTIWRPGNSKGLWQIVAERLRSSISVWLTNRLGKADKGGRLVAAALAEDPSLAVETLKPLNSEVLCHCEKNLSIPGDCLGFRWLSQLMLSDYKPITWLASDKWPPDCKRGQRSSKSKH